MELLPGMFTGFLDCILRAVPCDRHQQSKRSLKSMHQNAEPYLLDLYAAICHDASEQPSIESARQFWEQLGQNYRGCSASCLCILKVTATVKQFLTRKLYTAQPTTPCLPAEEHGSLQLCRCAAAAHCGSRLCPELQVSTIIRGTPKGC